MKNNTFRPLIGIVGLFVFVFIFGALRGYLATEFPFISVAASLGIFLIPGSLTAVFFLPEDDWVERIPLAILLSAVMLSIPAILVLAMHGNMYHLLRSFVGVTIGATLLFGFLLFRKKTEDEEIEKEQLSPLLIILLFAGMVLIFTISANVPMIGDDWVSLPWLWQLKTADQLMVESPYHGVDLTANIRQEFALLLLYFGLINDFSGLTPIVFYMHLRPLLALISIMSCYSLARAVFKRRNAAAMATIVWIAIMLANLREDMGGYHLVVRIAQDKFYLRYIIIPVALRLMLDYFQTHKRRYLILFVLASWGTGTTHPIGPAMLGLASGAFGAFHLLFNRDRKTFFRLIVVGLCVGIGVLVPIYQLLGAQDSVLALSLDGSTVDPSFNGRVRLATRASRLLFLENEDYTLHPSIFFDRMQLGLFLLPFWIWRARKDVPARLILGMFATLVLFYIPLTASFIGGFVTPWLLWRIAWVPEWGSWLILMGSAWLITEKIAIFLKWIRDRLSREMPLHNYPTSLNMNVTMGLVILLIFSSIIPTLYQNYLSLEDLLISNRQSKCLLTRPALEGLAAHVQSNAMVLASHDINFCIPSFSPWTKVIEYRGNTTLTRFANQDQFDEAWVRMEDEAYFSSTNYVDDEFDAILNRYSISYIVIEEDRLLDIQLKYLSDWFKLIVHSNGYKIYEVNKNRSISDIVSANSAIRNRQWQMAKDKLSAATEGSKNNKLLSHISLSQMFTELGDIKQSIRHMEQAVSMKPDDANIHAWLGATYMAGNKIQSAVNAYERAYELKPYSVSFTLALANVYRATGPIERSIVLYQEAAKIKAPVGSAYYGSLLGGYYTGARLYDDAISEYRHVLEIEPRQEFLHYTIGNLYLTKGDLNEAEKAYKSSLKESRWLAEPRVGLGQIYSIRGESEKAIEQFRKAITLSPTMLSGIDLFAREIEVTQGNDQAMESVQETLGYRLQLPSALSVLAGLHTKNGSTTEAVNLYHKAMLGDALRMGIYTQFKADAHRLGKFYEEAIIDYIKAEKLGGIQMQILLGKADTYNGLGKFDQAFGQYLEAVRSNPMSEAAHFQLGDSYLGSAEWESAISEYELVVRLSPSSIAGLLGLGNTYKGSGNYNEAIEAYQNGIRMNPDFLTFYFQLAEVYQSLGAMDDAKGVLINAASRNVDMERVFRAFGDHYILAGEYNLASKYYQEAIKTNPEYFDAYTSLADLFLILGDFDAAVKTLVNSISYIPDEIMTYQKLADYELVSGNSDAALVWLTKGVQAIPDSGAGYVRIAGEYTRRGDISKALDHYRLALAVDPGNESAYLESAGLYKDRGYFEEAEEVYIAGITAIPKSNSLYLGLSDLYLIQGKLDLTEKLLIEALSKPFVNAEIYHSLSEVQWLLDDPASANRTLIMAAEKLPAVASSYINLGDHYLRLGMYAEAQFAYAQSTSVKPKSVSGYYGLSQVALKNGDQSGAQHFLEEAIKRNPNSINGYLNLASFYESNGDIILAEENFLQVIKIDPLNRFNYISLGQFYKRQDRFDEALETLQKGLVLPPNTSGLYVTIGNAYLDKGDRDEALKWYQAAIPLNYFDSGPYTALSSFYQSEEKWEDAISALKIAVELQPTNWYVRMSMGGLNNRLVQYDLAEEEYKTACLLIPLSMDCHISLARLYQITGRWQEAITQLETTIYNFPTEFTANGVLGETYNLMGLQINAELAYTHGIHFSNDREGALLARARYFAKQGEFVKAQKDYELAWSVYPESQRTGSAYARFLAQRGDWKDSLNILFTLSELTDADASNQVALGNLYRARGLWGEAIEAFKKAILMDETIVEAYSALGQVYALQDRLDDELDVYIDATRSAPDNQQAFLTLGNAYLARLEYTSAKEAYEKVIEIVPLSTAPIAKLDNLNRKMGEGGIDLTPLSIRSEESPTFWLLNTLASQYQYRGEYDKALSYYQQAISLEPYFSDGWLALGNFYRTTQDWELALEAIDTALQYNPTSSGALMVKSAVQGNLGQTDDALETYTAAIEANRSLPSGYIALANLQTSLGFTGLALETLEEGLTASPASAGIYQMLSNVYVISDVITRALQVLEDGIDVLPGSPGIYINQGNIYEEQFIDAMKDLEIVEAAFKSKQQALDFALFIQRKEHNKRWTQRWVKAATEELVDAQNILEYYQKKFEEAELYFEQAQNAFLQALRMQPDNVDALFGLGRITAAAQAPEDSLWYYQEAVSKHPTWPVTLNKMGSEYLDLGLAEDAFHIYQISLQYSPNSLATSFGLSKVYSDLEKIDAFSAIQAVKYGQYWWDRYIDLFRRIIG